MTDVEDEDYRPPKRPRLDDDDDIPNLIEVDSDGEEVVEDTELGERLVRDLRCFVVSMTYHYHIEGKSSSSKVEEEESFYSSVQ